MGGHRSQATKPTLLHVLAVGNGFRSGGISLPWELIRNTEPWLPRRNTLNQRLSLDKTPRGEFFVRPVNIEPSPLCLPL